MRLIVERLAAGTVFFQAQDSPEEPMLQTRLPGEAQWENVHSLKAGWEVCLPVRGAQYMFRLADKLGQVPYAKTSIRILTPPPAPSVLGMGRNVCILWDCEAFPSVSTNVTAPDQQLGIRYIASWQRISRTGNVETEPESRTTLKRCNFTSENGTRALLAAFPQFLMNTEYLITLQTESFGAGEGLSGNETVKSAKSSPVRWFTGLEPPTLLSCIAGSNEVTLSLPNETDACSVLASLKLKSRKYVEGRCEGVASFQRLQRRASEQTLPIGDTVAVLGIPADTRCGIRMHCSIDLRALGASHFYWDTSNVLEVATLPNPPIIRGMASNRVSQPSCLKLSWSCALGIKQQKPPAYQIQIYSCQTDTYLTTFTTFAPALDLCAVGLESGVSYCTLPGTCRTVRLLRVPSASVPCRLLAHIGKAALVLLSPLPPTVSLVARSCSVLDRARISWDGAFDISNVHPAMSLLPVEFTLEVASSRALRFIEQRGCSSDQNQGLSGTQPDSKTHPMACTFQTIAHSRGAFCLTQILSPGLRYFFRLRLQTVSGVATSVPVEVETKPKVPDAPMVPLGVVSHFVSTIGHRAPFLRVSWDKPHCHGAPINRYLLQARRAGALPGTWGKWRRIYLGPQLSAGDEATLDAQATITQYRVKAGSILGWGGYSRILTVDAPNGLGSWQGQVRESLIGNIQDIVVDPKPQSPGDSIHEIRTARLSRFPKKTCTHASNARVVELDWSAKYAPSYKKDDSFACHDDYKLVVHELIRRFKKCFSYPIATGLFKIAIMNLRSTTAQWY